MSKQSESHDPEMVAEQTELNSLFFKGIEAVTPTPDQQISLRATLLQKLRQSITNNVGLHNVRLKDGVWQTLKTGVRFKLMWRGFEGNSVLIEFTPGASLPPHRHNWLEEGMVLSGGLQIGDIDLGPFDYQSTPLGSKHQKITSKLGALAYLRGTSLGDKAEVMQELIGGLLPFKGKHEHTVLINHAQDWVEVYPGVFKLDLNVGEFRTSSFFRIAPGASIPAHKHPQDEECIVLDGEVFLGDCLLKAGEYQLAAKGSYHSEVMSDIGCLLFIRASNEGQN